MCRGAMGECFFLSFGFIVLYFFYVSLSYCCSCALLGFLLTTRFCILNETYFQPKTNGEAYLERRMLRPLIMLLSA